MGRKTQKFLKYAKANASTVCVALSLVFFIVSLFINTSSRSSDRIEHRVERKVETRMRLLESHIARAAATDHDSWMDIDLPEDMVIYRYIYDTLQSWSNQFPVLNDDISSKVVFSRLSNLRTTATSPLKSVTDRVTFQNIGPKWYLVKSVSGGMACTIIAGLEVRDSYSENSRTLDNGSNRHLGIPGDYSISVLGDSGGIPILYQGVPVFKIFPEIAARARFLSDSLLRWIALLLVTLAFVLYLRQHRRPRNWFIVSGLILIAAVVGYVWGFSAGEKYSFFSPTVYADGRFLYSYGALTILNVTVLLLIVCTYSIRLSVYKAVLGRRARSIAASVLLGLAVLALLFYIDRTLHSLIMNSNIPWELYLWTEISGYTVLTYVIYSCLFFCALMLFQMLVVIAGDLRRAGSDARLAERDSGTPGPSSKAGEHAGTDPATRSRINVFGRTGLVLFALAVALYFTATSAYFGFRKEQNRVTVMSNRLAVDRDLSLEINLRSVEEGIASDPMIATLSHLDQSDYVILNRLNETYFSRISQNYDIALTVCPNNDANCFSAYEQRLFSGSPVAERSRFVYAYDSYGRSSYLGMFVYYSPDKGVSRIMIDISDKSNRSDRGYYSLLGRGSNPGDVDLPIAYSYAKYNSDRLTKYRGDFPYPTVITDPEPSPDSRPYVREGKYIHFINKIYDDEYIIVSRRTHSLAVYFVTFSYLLLINLLLLLPLLRRRRPRHTENAFRRNYYRSRINVLLFSALFLSLVVMAGLSVTLVYKHNASNMNAIMSEKITSVQTILEAQCRDLPSFADVNTRDLTALLENTGNEMKADITLFSTNGKVFVSTTSDIFDRLELGSRMNQEAYYNIMYRNLRLYINAERIRSERYWSLYAPIINSEGEVIAIVCVPYTEQNIDFRNEALFAAATFVNVFLILIVITLIVGTTVVNTMFKPLVEMGRKMTGADLQGLNYIVYKREDEVSTLVDAYNRMVHDLYESMKQVTQAERDKAWSEMARQVAHEIKNPLTPIKLELQRLIRLKQRNDPSWSEKFDRVSAIILEHIDILTDTANEFSTFAKLYSEEPVLIDLDSTLRDQIVIFDNRDNITISYMGLSGAFVTAPKPQLIRVFVNLITNAVQAVEISQNEARDAGLVPERGRILVSLRNSVVREGCYDIVVEDNGPGVKEENRGRLFTPNFTTKTGGTGLGLAICRNIIEKCNGTIFYQRSFSLSGACFVVTLPRSLNDLPSGPGAESRTRNRENL